jgi:uncharacterized membrane protein
MVALLLVWHVLDRRFARTDFARTLEHFAANFALLGGLAFGLTQLISGRAAYIHVGVILGTIMTGNVWMVIIPSQRELVAATKDGRAQDPEIGKRAKQRSIHNNYMTFPLLFMMISNHFPVAYGQKLNWLVLIVLIVGGALTRHFMNIRFYYKAWFPAATAVILASVIALFVLTKPKASPPVPHAKVEYARAREIVNARCVPCHSEKPSDDIFKVAPNNVKMDTAEQMKLLAPRLKARAYELKTMPLMNKTLMTDEERAELAAWVDQGALTP